MQSLFNEVAMMHYDPDVAIQEDEAREQLTIELDLPCDLCGVKFSEHGDDDHEHFDEKACDEVIKGFQDHWMEEA